MSESTVTSIDDIFSILVATDIHLGAHEKDPIRANDTYNTFEEILQLGAERDVDFIILGGDLFHENRPSAQCLHRCMGLLRKYCMGDKPISVEFLSNQAEVFKHCVIPVVNYEDPNFNVSIPIFSIHGNHDDPTGLGRLSALDLLSVSGLVNYFGKIVDLTQITVKPILLQKGSSKLALYGLCHIKDQRLSRLFRDGKVEMVNPGGSDVMNILVLHQNRADRGENNYISESVLPDFIDLIIWGHEHECKIDLEWNNDKQFYITQPGSPVATSLCEGESVSKHVGILQVAGKKFKLEPIELKTVRPLVFDTVVLSECSLGKKNMGGKPSSQTEKYLVERVNSLLVEAKQQLTGHPKQPELPLVRLRVDYSQEYECFNAIRFGQSFSGRVANPMDMIKLKREASKTRTRKGDKIDMDAIGRVLEEEEFNDEVNIEQVLENYFIEADLNKQLKVLSVKGLGEAVNKFISTSDKEALPDIVGHQMKKTSFYLRSKEVNESNIEEILEEFREMRKAKVDDRKEARELLESNERSSFVSGSSFFEGKHESTVSKDPSTSMEIGSDSDEEFRSLPSTVTSSGVSGKRGRGRGSRGGRGGPGTTTGRRGRGSRGGKNNAVEISPDKSRLGGRGLNQSVSSSTTSESSYKTTNTRQQNLGDMFNLIPRSNSSNSSASPSFMKIKKRKLIYGSDED